MGPSSPRIGLYSPDRMGLNTAVRACNLNTMSSVSRSQDTLEITRNILHHQSLIVVKKIRTKINKSYFPIRKNQKNQSRSPPLVPACRGPFRFCFVCSYCAKREKGGCCAIAPRPNRCRVLVLHRATDLAEEAGLAS